MSMTQTYPGGVPYRQPRPRGENSLAAIVLGALGWWLTGPIGGVAGGAIGNSQPLPLEAAIRTYFTQAGIPLVRFYRLGPQAARVLFRYRDQFWTITSRANQSPDWTPESLDDWLYGDLLDQLNVKLNQLGRWPHE